MDELKPCPFCNSHNIYLTYAQEYAGGYKEPIIFCNDCKAQMTVEDDSPYIDMDKDYEYRRMKTVTAWNRRAGEQNAAD